MIVRPPSRHSWSLLYTLRGSILPSIWPRLSMMTALATAVAAFSRSAPGARLELSAAPLTLIGLTLAIFLGFRNGVAYERWWEARKLWGELLIVCRNLARQTVNYLPPRPASARREQLHRLVAYAHALRHQLRGTPPEADMLRWLPSAEADELRARQQPASLLLAKIGASYAAEQQAGRLDSMTLMAIDAQLGQLSQVLGGCERIKHTPIPYAYILLLHRTVYAYCLLTPFCLVSSLGWFTPFVVALLAYTFFGLDALGEQIEDPFDLLPNDLPLDALCRTLEISIAELLGDADAPTPLAPVDGCLS